MTWPPVPMELQNSPFGACSPHRAEPTLPPPPSPQGRGAVPLQAQAPEQGAAVALEAPETTLATLTQAHSQGQQGRGARLEAGPLSRWQLLHQP